MKHIIIVWTADLTKARQYADHGFEPIECSIDGQSVMGPLNMDHHNDQSHRLGVAVRAYRDHFGARKDDPRFVVTGAADADATFAIAALCGILPHPSRATEFENAPPHVKAAGTRDLNALADIVNHMDVDPIGIRLEGLGDDGATLLLWNQLASRDQDATAFHAGIDRWRMLLGNPPKALLEGALAQEADRVAKARRAQTTFVSDGVTLVESTEWGFDIWYADHTAVIALYNPVTGSVAIGCPNAEKAEELFGKGGLKNVFADLQPQGWGGREAIGGSPRGQKLSHQQALDAARVVAKMVKP